MKTSSQEKCDKNILCLSGLIYVIMMVDDITISTTSNHNTCKLLSTLLGWESNSCAHGVLVLFGLAVWLMNRNVMLQSTHFKIVSFQHCLTNFTSMETTFELALY